MDLQNLTWHKEQMSDGRTYYEDKETSRWRVLENSDGTWSVKDYGEEQWMAEAFPTAQAAQQDCQRLQNQELEGYGL